jgi:hypothetical protein
MPAEGIEPTRSCDHWILSPARLPVPPRRRRAALMPAAGPARVASVEFVCAAALSAVAPLLPAGPGLPKIPGRALRRFSVAFAEWAVEFPVAVADPVRG